MPRVRLKLPATLAARIYRLHLKMSGKGAKRSLWSRRFTVADRAKCERVGICLESNNDILDMWRVARGTDSFHESVVEVAHALGYITSATREEMLTALIDDGTQREKKKRRSVAMPHWDHESRELRYRGRVVRTVKRPGQANNIVTLLRAFERAGWPPRIDDPFRRKSNDETRRRDVETLNKRLDTTLMFFECDGDGKGFLWKRTPRAKAKKAAKRRRRRTKPS